MTGTTYRVLLLTGQEIGPVDLNTLAYMAQGGQIGPFSPITDLDTRRQFTAADHPYLAARLPKAPAPIAASAPPGAPARVKTGALGAVPPKAMPWLIGIGVLFLIGVLSGGGAGGATDLDAWQMSKQFVTRGLKAPKTADFPWFSEEFVQRGQGSNDFTVSAYVDSQNSFGALIRSDWTARVHHEGSGNWRLRYLRIGDETILNTAPEPETPPQGTTDFEDKGRRSPEGDAALRRLRQTGVG